jgi:ribosomal protein S18 acetylase RimI-like enzyme
MDNVTIVKLTPQQWQELKQIRLHALESDPDAFGRTHEELSQKTDEQWMQQLQNPHLHYFIAKVNDEHVGVVGIAKDREEDDTTEIVSMFVKKPHRRRGIGKTLLHHAVSHGKQQHNSQKAKVWVYKHRDDAVNFYKKHNFTPAREINTDPSIDPRYHNTYQMEMPL